MSLRTDRLARFGILAPAIWGLLAIGGPADAEDRFRFDALRSYGFDGVSSERRAAGFQVVDLDGDGHLDVLTDESHRFGPGDGTLGPQVLQQFGFPFLVTDFTGDGYLDVIYVFEHDEIWLSRGGPGGKFGFGTELDYPGVRARCLDVADLDGDGNLDLLVGRNHGGGGGRLVLLYTDENRGVESVFQLGIRRDPLQVQAKDLDQDGRLDVLVLNENRVQVFWGQQGSRILDGPLTYLVRSGDELTNVEVVDLDRDGDLDLAVGSQALPAILIGEGRGTRALGPVQELDPGLNPGSITTGDLDHDGNLDLVARDGFRASVLRGRSGLGFRSPVHLPLSVGTGVDLALADMDEDERLDLFYGSIQAGSGRGDFSPASLQVPAPNQPQLVDLNSDGILDVIVGQNSSPNINVLLGTGAGEFGEVRSFPVDGGPHWIAVSDLDSDGVLDVAVANEVSQTVFILLGSGTGTDWTLTLASSFFVPVDVPVALSAIELSGDGNPDLVVFYPHLVAVYLGDGTGRFSRGTDFPLANLSTRPVILDREGDGTEDIFLIADLPDLPRGIVELRNDGSGTLTPTFVTGVPLGADVFLGELNNDGHRDLVVTLPRAFFQSDFIRVYLNDGAGGFTFQTQFEHPEVGTLHTADFDGDGNEDLLVRGRFCLWFFEVLPGDGNGGFGPPTEFGIPVSCFSALGDLDGDGADDLVFANDGDFLSLVFNRVSTLVGCRTGTVNATTGGPVDVLFVNDSPGTDPERLVALTPDDPLTIRMIQPPSEPPGTTDYVAYLELGLPREAELSRLPFGLGPMCLVTPLNGVTPDLVANTLGFERFLGTTNWPDLVSPAPSDLVSVQRVGLNVRFRIQGLIEDSTAPLGVSRTNGVVVVVE